MKPKNAGMFVVVTAGLLAIASAASAQYPLDNKYEEKCASGLNKALGKFTGAKAKCVTKCQQGARKALNPFSDCLPPYGGATAFCVSDPTKGAEAKAIVSAQKGCLIDCPECYSGGNCPSYISGRVYSTESQLDGFVPLIWCDDSGSGDGLNPAEAKCQDATGKALAKFVASKGKCYDKCLADQIAGKVVPGQCAAGVVTAPATQACIFVAEQKAAAGIDKVCALDEPECYVPNFDSGAEWVSLAESAVDANVPQTYCGSPSGAFVE
jgi:hypothetical protein